MGDIISFQTVDGGGGKYPSDFSFLYSTDEGITNLVVNRLAKTIQGEKNSYALKNCANTLVSFSFQDDPLLETIQSYAFLNCISLTKIDLSPCSHLKYIGQHAFENCNACSIIKLPNGLQTIDIYAFYQSGIQSISLPDSLQSIPQYCFLDCKQLTNIEILPTSQLKSINRLCIPSTKVQTIFIPAAVNFVDSSSFESSSLIEIRVSPDNNIFRMQNNLLIAEGKYIITRPPGLVLDTLEIPEGIYSVNMSSCNAAKIKHISFPSSLRIIENWAFACSEIVDLNLPDTITYIGGTCFGYCRQLQTINLPNNIVNLTYSAFRETAISEITIPSSVENIEVDCFTNCPNLFKIVLPESVKMLGGIICSSWTKLTFDPNSKLYIDDQLLIIDKLNTTVMAYIGPNSAATINILPKITTINDNAFRDKSELTMIKFPQNSALTKISEGCFRSCFKLQFIDLPASIEYIGNYAFSDCRNLDSFASSSLNFIGEYCFTGCTNLVNLNIKSSPLSTMNINSFYGCTSLNSVELPQSLSEIKVYVFYNCLNLQTVVFPATLSRLDDYCFTNCNLEIVDLYACAQLKKIPDYAFSNNKNLVKIILPPNLENITYESFSFTSITNFTAPPKLTFIGNSAFKGCNMLTTIKIERDSLLKSFGIGPFKDCVSLSKIVCDNSNFVVDNGALFSSDRSSLILFPPAASIKYFYMPATTKTISEFAFMNCMNLHTILIPSDSIKFIGDNAFEGCKNLQIINIPISVTAVGTDAFKGCNSLRCGLAIENRNSSFLKSLTGSSKLSPFCLKECKYFATQNCYEVYGGIYKLYILPFIIL